jgi:cell division protein ZapE
MPIGPLFSGRTHFSPNEDPLVQQKYASALLSRDRRFNVGCLPDGGRGMTIREEYERLLAGGQIVPDNDQIAVVSKLEALQSRLQKQLSGTSMNFRLPWSRAKAPPRGIYLWGGVGRGKTFLMDLFFSTLDVRKKKRIHFHRMMSDVHRRLGNIRDTVDPLDQVAADIAAETLVLCFDEFYVSDIGDAMILGRLLEALFERGVTLVATSNSHPRNLYHDGLQRARFIPAIEALETHTEVIELPGDADHRLRLFEEAGTWFVPDDAEADRKLNHYFAEIASGDVRDGRVLSINGRPIESRRCAKGIVWFDFHAICDGPRSQEDYIEIARWYPAVIVTGVPALDKNLDNAARRFIALVDEFYDRKVKLLASAAVLIPALYTGSQLEFEFQRTISRLTEMQTRDYLHAEHLA